MDIIEIRNIIRRAVATVLNLGSFVSDDDDIFDLGAESVDVPQVVVIVEKECNVHLKPDDLDVAPTVAGIAEAVAKAKQE